MASRRTLVPPAGIPLRRLLLRSLRSAGRDIHVVLDPIRLGLSVPQAFVLLLARRPAAIFTTGGYVAIPTLLAAWALRIPSVLWEGNVVPGRSVRFVAGLATVLAVSYAETAAALDHGRSYVTGHADPVPRGRGSVDEARERFGGRPGERILLVFGGSQAVQPDQRRGRSPRCPGWSSGCAWSRSPATPGTRRRWPRARRCPPSCATATGRTPFLHGDDMTAALAAADLAVGRAGASTIAEASAFALPMAIVPYPHAAGHQRRNAELQAAAGAAILIEDEDLDADRLVEVAGLLADPAAHAAMSAAARELARPDAAAAVADLVLAVAHRDAPPTQDEIEGVARGPRP